MKRMFITEEQRTLEDAYKHLSEDVDFALDVDEVDLDDEIPNEVKQSKVPKIVTPEWVNDRIYHIYKFVVNLQKDFVGKITETKENEKIISEINKDLLNASEGLIKLVRSTRKLRDMEK